MIRKLSWTVWLGALVAVPLAAAEPLAPADLAVTETVLRPAAQVPPLGANYFGGVGAIEWAANNFIHNPGNEPIHWRNLHRAVRVGPNWFELDGPGTSWYDLWANGFLSGADLRIYRLIDRDGNPLPTGNTYPDVAKADHVVCVGKTRVLPAGSPGFPDGGWVATKYGDVYPNAMIRHGNLTVTDTTSIRNGRTYWYRLVAVGADGTESDPTAEVSATPKADVPSLPHVVTTGQDDKLPAWRAGQEFAYTPRVVGGQPPYRWELVGPPPPAGVTLDPATGRLAGRPTADLGETRFQLKVTDAAGHSDTRWYTINPMASSAKGKPEPPRGLQATAGDGTITLTWQASPSPNVVAYRLKRSVAPLAEQQERVYVEPGGPELKPFDYVVVEKRFDPFDMALVHPRVRGIGNPVDSPSWYWNTDLSSVSLALVPHPKPVPADLVDPGETCLQATSGPGEHSLSQLVFIGTQMGGESLWYGQLEPGAKYRLEVWLRQEGLGHDGQVTFSFGRGYKELHTVLPVTGQWTKFTWDCTGPPRPAQEWHFGPTFTFTGPGKLWMDNARLFRVDRPEDAAKPYVPEPTVLKELVAAQPETGPKGAHRTWYLSRDATMDSILSWHATSKVRPDWATRVEGTMSMTLPMGLEFDRLTGPDPASRMRPWLVLQHILHSEADWLALVEYLAAPYDPAKDTPQAKPWAFRRYQQRGVGTPWTDEFAQLTIEFGNETWHNGYFEDWLGFRLRNQIHQGGREYGLFAEYLIGTMRRSPYWQAAGLDRKLRFSLGANYDGRIDKDGRVRGYGEEAMQASPSANVLGHANYVGPKWETGDKSSSVFDDHGIQETLLAWLTGCEPAQRRMAEACEALAKAGHPYELGAYEGGPSGYALPGRDSPEQREVNEQYGKSLAMAVAALDGWLGSYRYGWSDQCFLAYGQGTRWDSHTGFADGFRPSPGWLALALRNRFARGDLVDVTVRQTPTIQRGTQTYPLIGAYAFRDGSRWSVFVLSRKLNGQHDGVDFGDGTTPVTLRLPFTSARSIALHRLTGDPRQNNRERMAITPQDVDVPATALKGGVLTIDEASGGARGGLPPGSIYLYVFEGASGG